ncbi:winged helix-turn-helix domain-containing protein [Paracoccus sp. R12_1]|uniref:winged helix-turn-helix domain-containing protein n=1 Tax=unclassified Paracoccus (in: a-proteobacteria) TaxID=2688777 RepID=UPI001ADAC6B7|nr:MULTISPECIES: winged helix-turn-helix domain-containing protein [unclassified Paracoccus (in: a-proteobacteria)]MBO9457394.1 winged helix-turn-helix domain-containing protein [Paracoccus sp. R12_2]MBO9488671.1 winged helix-turn-helix domain-containing protein [Paracoccus sp. R12_1]
MDLGEHKFDPESGDLSTSDGRPVTLKRQARALIQALVTAEGRVVSKDQLMDAVWPDVTVSEDSLYQAVAEARRALGANGGEIIRSVPRQGYLLDATGAAQKGPSRWPLMTGLVLAVALGALAVWSQRQAPGGDIRHPVIAVLPFEALAGDETWQRRGAGLSVEIATELARNDWLDVVAPEATETLAGSALLPAAEAVGARFILAGALAAEDGAMRVSARMMDAETGKLIWSDRWNRDETGFLDLEADVLDRIAGPLGGALTGAITQAELSSSQARQAGSLDAYDHFLLGLEAKHHWNREGFTRATTHFKQAIALDPDYAKAWSFLSLNLSFLALEAASQEERQMLWQEASDAAERAYALDPDDPEVLWRVARERGAQGDLENARRMLRRSVALAPGNADVLMVAAWTSHYAGVRGDEPLTWARRAHELTPIRPAKYTISLGLAAFSAKDYQLCVETLRNAPRSPEVLAHLAAAEALLGNVSKAREVGRLLREARRDFVIDDMFGPVGLDGFDDLEDLRQGAALAGVPVSRAGRI